MKILINRTDAIGDNILTMPICSAIKSFYPKSEIGIITSKRCDALYDNHKFVDKYYIFDKNQGLISKIKNALKIFKDFSPTHYLFVGGSHVPSFISYLKRTGFRGGLKSKWQTFLFLNQGIRQKRSIVAMHESEYNLELLRPLIEKDLNVYEFDSGVRLESDEKKAAFSMFKEDALKTGVELKNKIFFVHPGMTGHTLNWSSRNYGRLVNKLLDEYSEEVSVIISYTPGDERFLTGLRDELEKTKSKHGKSVYFFDGSKRGLRNYMNVLSNASLFLGPSTGTTHIANILGIKTISIYSPIKVQSSMRWRPFHNQKDRLSIVVPDVVCGEQFKCAGEICPYHECMAKIEVADIMKEVKNFLELK